MNSLIQLSYFAAAVLFIMGLKRMSSPVTARGGIVWAGVGMLAFVTVVLALAIYFSRKRGKSPDDHAYLGRTVGVLLVSFYALYYYWLHSTI